MTTPTGLVERIRAGESAAFDEAYRLYQGRLYSYLRRLAREPMIAEDLFQETWMQLARHGRDLSETTNLEAWLFTVARNRFFDQRRWQVFNLKRLRAFFELPRQHSTAAAIGLEDALAALPPADRELLLLVAETGLDLQAVAGVMNMSYASLRQRLSRARARLVAALEQDGMHRS